MIDQLRPSPLVDITEEPLSEITPSSWHVRQPIIILRLQPTSGGPPIQRAFRLTRETPVEWVPFQPGIFSFAFVKCEDEGIACVLELWETLVVAVTAPWPDSRGPMRRGRKNPRSREAAQSLPAESTVSRAIRFPPGQSGSASVQLFVDSS